MEDTALSTETVVLETRSLVAGFDGKDVVKDVSLAVPAGKIIIDRHHMDPFSGQCIKIDRESPDESFPLATLHLGDLPLMEHDPAQELHIEMAHVEHAPPGLAGHGKCLRQNLVQDLVSRLQPPLA